MTPKISELIEETPAAPEPGAHSKQIRAYIDHYKELVDLERAEEMAAHEREMKQLSGREREEKGRALLKMRGRKDGEGLAGFLVKFTRKGGKLPDTEISVGDLVMISKQDPLRDDNPTGTVIQKTNYSITAAFDNKPHGFVFGKGLRIDLFVNDITFQRMLAALDTLENADGDLGDLRNIIAGTEEPRKPEPEETDVWYNSSLNRSQRDAVERALGSEDFYLVHGPPGTGKTTTVIEIIEQYARMGKSVLATADSNMAVDNLVEFLVDQGVHTVRVGHPARVTQKLHDHTLDSLVQGEGDYWKGQNFREKAMEVKAEQENLVYPSGKNRRGLSNSRIKKLARHGKGSRGLSPDKIHQMAQWIDKKEKIDDYFDRAKQLEDQAVASVLEKAEVVCSTNATAGSEVLEDMNFDVLVIDEATQATEPSCLIPITNASQVIMAGDHKQLPPTILSREAEDGGLGVTLFERLAEDYNGTIMDMLEQQYRMHEDIMNFSGKQFYDSSLKADKSVREHTLDDLNFQPETAKNEVRKALDPENPVVFLDTATLDAPEHSREGSTSKENPAEAELTSELARTALEAGLSEPEVAVIAPYHDQVDRISKELADRELLEVKTVDGFQGREKECVIISLVRSNPRENVGFLTDLRRLNVALTRAKRKLIVIGDSETVQSEDTYQEFINYAKRVGVYQRL